VGNRKPRRTEGENKKCYGSKIKKNQVIQYDLNMNLIKEWKSLREIERIDAKMSKPDFKML
jgi:hypothetical protein